jgi:hypothetical protein
MTKYYRVIKTVPGFDVGAILKSEGGGYRAIDDIWDRFDGASEGVIHKMSIELEANKEFFLRVYPIGDKTKGIFGTKEQAQVAANALYQGDKE